MVATSLDSSSIHFITLFNRSLLSVSIVNVTGTVFAKLVLGPVYIDGRLATGDGADR